MTTMLSIPCTYDNDTLFIKCLDVRGIGWPVEEAFFDVLKANPDIYADLCTGKLEVDSKNRYSIIVPYSKKLHDRILEIEPLSDTVEKIKVAKDSFLKVTNEEILKYGY